MLSELIDRPRSVRSSLGIVTRRLVWRMADGSAKPLQISFSRSEWVLGKALSDSLSRPEHCNDSSHGETCVYGMSTVMSVWCASKVEGSRLDLGL